MAEKSFVREEYSTVGSVGSDEGVYFSSKQSKWFDFVQIYTMKDGKLLAFPEIRLELKNEWRDSSSEEKEVLRKLTAKLRKMSSFTGEGGDEMYFTASPTSDIRSVLTQAELPTDMQVAIMNELQQMWREKAK